jgi:hypothetical protein
MNRRLISLESGFTITVSSKEGNTTTALNTPLYNAGGFIKQVIVKAPYPSSTFDFRIENSSGNVVYRRTEQVGEIAEECEIPLPAGRYTLYISNASHDGSYACELIFAEVW